MSYRLSVRQLAERDLEQAQERYEGQHPGLGDEFLTAIVELFDRLQDNPRIYPVVYRGLRRAILRRFPYLVYFRLDGTTVTILACLHGQRDPRLLQRRLG